MQSLKNRPRTVSALVLAAMAASLASTAGAVPIDKADNALNLNDPASWVTLFPGTNDVAQWSNVVTGANTAVLGGSVGYQGIAILDPGGLVTINAGNTLALGSSGIDMTAATQNFTVNAAVRLDAAQIWDVAAGRTLTLGGAVKMNNDLTIQGDGNVTTGNLGDTSTGSLVKNGIGTLTFTGQRVTYTGTTTVNGGLMNVNVPANQGDSGFVGTAGLIINNGGTVRIGMDNGLVGYNGDAANQVPVTINAGGKLTIAAGKGAHMRGVLNLNGGELASEGTNLAWGTWNLDGAQVNVNGGLVTSVISAQGVSMWDGGTDTTFNVASGAANGIDLDVTGTLIHPTNVNGKGMIKTGAGVMRLGASNTYRGKTTVKQGTLSISSIANVAAGVPTSVGNPLFGGDGLIGIGEGAVGAVLQYTGAGHATNRAIDMAGTTGGATLDASGSGALTHNTGISASGAGAKTLTLAGSGMGIINGNIANNSGANQTSVVKTGSGTWALNVNNNYDGTTTIDGGTLQFNANGSNNFTAVTINSAGTLGGNGTLRRAVTSLGGTIAPGTSAGTLTVIAGVYLDAASDLAYELNGTNLAVGGGVNDLLTSVTDLQLDGMLNVTETVAGSFLAANLGDTWRLINYTGVLTDNGLQIGLMPTLSSGLAFGIDTVTPGQVNLTITQVVPEPISLALLAAGGMLITLPRRRRH